MKKRFPGFTVLIERALRLSCVLGVAALAAACGGGEAEPDSSDEPSAVSVQDTVGARTRFPARSNGIILSEKYNRPVAQPGIILSEKVRGGIILSELGVPASANRKADAPVADDDEAVDE